jgi:outer membrane protein assembly factor BamD
MKLRIARRVGAALLCVWLGALLVACGSTPKDEGSTRSAERLYKEAKEDMDSGSYDRAIKSLERVEGLGAGSLLSQQAQLDLAYLYWRTNERTQALSTIERFIKLNPSSPALDYGLYLRGVINFNDNLGLLGNLAGQDLAERDQRASRDAFVAFKQLVEQFPDSPYSADARLRMQYIVQSLANYELHVARYYFRRGAYVAAINRAQQAVSEFQQAAAVEEALFIMAQSYDRLQLPELRDAAERVLKANYPQSRFLAETTIGGDAPRPWWRLW